MKLSKEVANEYLATAVKSVRNHPKLRFGQALFNCLPRDTSNIIYMTDKDFFYWPDSRMVWILDVFFSECVEK